MNSTDVLNELNSLLKDKKFKATLFRNEVQSIINRYNESQKEWEAQDAEAIERLTDGLLKIAESFNVKYIKIFETSYSRDFRDASDHLIISIRFNSISVENEQRIVDILNEYGNQISWTYRIFRPREEWKKLPNTEPIMYIHTALHPQYVETVETLLNDKITNRIDYYEKFEKKLA